MTAPDTWWYNEAARAVIQGPGFDFTTVLTVEGDELVIRPGKDPDNPLRVPLAKISTPAPVYPNHEPDQ